MGVQKYISKMHLHVRNFFVNFSFAGRLIEVFVLRTTVDSILRTCWKNFCTGLTCFGKENGIVLPQHVVICKDGVSLERPVTSDQILPQNKSV
jgi:hypothetical protein